MEAIKTTANRIHPLMAAAAASVIVVSLVGTAAITGMLPSSNSAPSPQAAAMMGAQNGYLPATAYGQPPMAQALMAQPSMAQPVAYMQPAAATYAQAAPAPAPVVIKETIIKEVPVKQAAPRPHRHAVVHHTQARDDRYVPVQRPAPQPNYVGIGTGAVIGGLIGNQIGSGNGRKLATVAGMIGGGMIGNQMINTNR